MPLLTGLYNDRFIIFSTCTLFILVYCMCRAVMLFRMMSYSVIWTLSLIRYTSISPVDKGVHIIEVVPTTAIITNYGTLLADLNSVDLWSQNATWQID